jgi:hypothetical protein
VLALVEAERLLDRKPPGGLFQRQVPVFFDLGEVLLLRAFEQPGMKILDRQARAN